MALSSEPEDQADAIQKIPTEVDMLLRRGLRETGCEVAHVNPAVDEDGFGIIRTYVDPPTWTRLPTFSIRSPNKRTRA